MAKPFWEEEYKNNDINTFGEPSQEIIELSNTLSREKIIFLPIHS